MAFQLPAPIDNTQLLEEMLRRRLAILAQPTRAQTLAPIISEAIGNVGRGIGAGIQGYREGKRERSLVAARKLASDPNVTLQQRNEALLSLGITPMELKQEPLSRIEAESAAKTRGMMSAYPQTEPPTGPEITEKDGLKFLVNKNLKGQTSYSQLQGQQLPVEISVKMTLAEDGLKNLNEIETMLNSPKGRELALKAGGNFDRLKTLGDPDAEILANAIFQAADAEARVKTGAAINVQEVNEYFKKLVNPVGTMAGNLDRIRRKKEFFGASLNLMRAGRNVPGQKKEGVTKGGPDPLGLFK